jgi:excinuclease ABC subunit C
MNERVKQRLKELPTSPGVYLHKDKSGEIIYVGKAARLRSRVRQYFQKSRSRDSKTDLLVAEIADIDWIEVESELDALFLEAELVRRYLPRYNILLRDDKSSLYVRVNMKDDYPYVSFTRRPLDDGATYIGPFFNGPAVRKALKVLRKIFPYSTHHVLPPRVCLQYHLGLCPGVEENKITSKEYKKNLRRLVKYLRGGRQEISKQLEKEMKEFSSKRNYEKAAEVRNKLLAIQSLNRQIIFSDKEFLDISKDHALNDLAALLGLYEDDKPKVSHSGKTQGAVEQRTESYKEYDEGVAQTGTQQLAESSSRVAGSASKSDRTLRSFRRIEGYDISHMGGTNTVASMVVFTNGLPDKTQYRKFAMRLPGNDDFAHMREVMSRRFSGRHKDWAQPDLLLIDGGKGQLSSVLDVIRPLGIEVPAVGLAKKRELIIIDDKRSNVSLQASTLQKLGGFSNKSEEFTEVDVPNNSHLIKLLQRIRDESHRFAVSYHTNLKRSGQVKSQLDSILGVGPATRKKLVKNFGSVAGVKQASEAEIAAVVGKAKAQIIKSTL